MSAWVSFEEIKKAVSLEMMTLEPSSVLTRSLRRSVREEWDFAWSRSGNRNTVFGIECRFLGKCFFAIVRGPPRPPNDDAPTADVVSGGAVIRARSAAMARSHIYELPSTRPIDLDCRTPGRFIGQSSTLTRINLIQVHQPDNVGTLEFPFSQRAAA